MSVYHFTPRSRNRLERQLSHQCGAGNVVQLRRAASVDAAKAFNALTFELVMSRVRAGTLEPGVAQALLLGVGIEP
jgi:hypothetical protein